ncbi:hypothetical protein BB561_003372 [Smittium simulii]|uniref:3-beta hydroxysteroid dehydrogenase/isomerase domain-containing protein n=1 Tax=Smittium simulii TaxID=133385 RepID=A0A2T9YLW4_9FUNG|nr:hypothetical protein BB561_003372 [Smittium simulii]
MMLEADQVYMVVGGCGLLGSRILQELIKKKKADNPNYPKSDIRVVDIRNTATEEPEDYCFYVADICEHQAITDIIVAENKKVTTVFHTASPIMKAPPEIHTKVNIEGTKALLDVCIKTGVKSFIYTSSASVVYSGAPLVYVDETIPYAQPFADYYSETKAIAEKMCLSANGSGGIKTVSLRPSGIFGPGDNQVTPGALMAQKKGYPPLIQVGNNTALFDFTFVDNLVDAHISASDKLACDNTSTNQDSDYRIDGQSFFITNDQPIGMWSFLRLLWAEVGDNRKPILIIPTFIASFILYLLRFLASIKVVKHEVPFVFGMTFTDRYFNISKAKKLLDYKPRVSYSQGVPISVASTLKRWEEDKNSKNN